MMYRIMGKTSKTKLKSVSHVAVLLVTLFNSPILLAQNFDKVIPMGNWANFKLVTYSGSPIPLHLRTGYERAILFPEPIALYAINNRPVTDDNPGIIPGCDIEIDTEVIGFSPRQRFKPQTVSVRGQDSGLVYELLVSSSPLGSRQPIEVIR